LHWLALPTPYIAADLPPDPNRKVYVGAHTMLILPVGSKVEFAEFKGQGLGSLERAVEASENRMAALGARLIEPRRAQVETAETARIRQSGESSVLSGIVTAMEIAFTKLLSWVAEWEGASPDEVAVSINRDLIETKLDANMVTALMQGVNTGRISAETFYWNLQEGGLTMPNDTFEEEKKRIEEDVSDMVSPIQSSFVQPVGSSDKAQFPSMT